MIGIVSYGSYIPRLRLSRQSIYRQLSWLAPGLGALARGERSMANFDEDSVTMAVAAARDCLSDLDKSNVRGGVPGINHLTVCRSAQCRDRGHCAQPAQ